MSIDEKLKNQLTYIQEVLNKLIIIQLKYGIYVSLSINETNSLFNLTLGDSKLTNVPINNLKYNINKWEQYLLKN